MSAYAPPGVIMVTRKHYGDKKKRNKMVRIDTVQLIEIKEQLYQQEKEFEVC